MKYQVLFSLKHNNKEFINVVCCSCDWRFKGQFLNCGVNLLFLGLINLPVILFLKKLSTGFFFPKSSENPVLPNIFHKGKSILKLIPAYGIKIQTYVIIV